MRKRRPMFLVLTLVAVLGFGASFSWANLPVFDAKADIDRKVEILKLIAQLQTAKDQLAHLKAQAKQYAHFNYLGDKFMMIGAPGWRGCSSRSWASTLKAGLGAVGAYLRLAPRPNWDCGTIVNELSRRDMERVELADSLNVNTYQTAGATSKAVDDMNWMVGELWNKSMDTSDEATTTSAQLQKIAAASAFQATAQQHLMMLAANQARYDAWVVERERSAMEEEVEMEIERSQHQREAGKKLTTFPKTIPSLTIPGQTSL